MGQQILLKSLIICLTLSQGFAFVTNNSSVDTPDLLVRNKRVIDRTANANTRVRLRDVPYLVYVQENGAHACAGTILSHSVILVPCSCVMNLAIYTVISGTIATRGGRSHIVTGILRHPLYVPHAYKLNIALLSIDEPIIFGFESNNEPITIFQSLHGQLRPNTLVTVSGYGLAIDHRNGGVLGCNNGIERQIMPNKIRSIRLPTISTQQCAASHNNDPEITPQEVICTFHPNKFCSPGDSGSALVYQHFLFGILSSDGDNGRPEIFVNVAAPANRNWIYGHMDRIPNYVGPAIQHENRPRPRRPYLNSHQVHPHDW